MVILKNKEYKNLLDEIHKARMEAFSDKNNLEAYRKECEKLKKELEDTKKVLEDKNKCIRGLENKLLYRRCE